MRTWVWNGLTDHHDWIMLLVETDKDVCGITFDGCCVQNTHKVHANYNIALNSVVAWKLVSE